MTDRQRDDEYLRARKLAYSLDKRRLERIRSGSYVIKDIPEYLRLMREHGFNPESREHCVLVAETLEQRLEHGKSEEIILGEKGLGDTSFMINYSTTGMIKYSGKIYRQECKELELELKNIFKQFCNSEIFNYGWEQDIFNEPGARYYLRIKSGRNKLNVIQVFKDTYTCHGFMDLQISNNGFFGLTYISGAACNHIMDRGGIIIPKSLSFSAVAKNIYHFYIKSSKMPNSAETLNHYFRFFVSLPKKLKEVCEEKANIIL